MNTWASFPCRLLAAATLDGQLKRDWTSKEHSVEVASIEQILARNWMSDDSMKRLGINLGGRNKAHQVCRTCRWDRLCYLERSRQKTPVAPFIYA